MRKSTWSRSKVMCVVGALVLGSSVIYARASTIGDSNLNRASVVDCLNSLGMKSSISARRILAEQDTHAVMRKTLPYRKTADQNKHLLADYCPDWSTPYGYNRTASHPKVSEAERQVIIAGLREIARKHGVDEVKFVNTARCESQFYALALGDQRRSRGIFQYLKGKNGHRGKMPDSVAFNWRMASDSAAVDFSTEGWKKHYVKVLDAAGNPIRYKNGRIKYVWDGTYYWDSTAWRWTCFRNLYGRTSARVIPSANAPAWAISPSARSVASTNSD
jgi:hypothetical protein